ncbi:molybdopterin-dependent oxidoreductase [Amycolatopsis sp. NPDC006131]|uniref:molybdopterin-dependent oxidoreductase n=1 Tax=Amycolatopsis sp. NPDC006131 TaxID=3156731 RepID=UPI0033A76ED9
MGGNVRRAKYFGRAIAAGLLGLGAGELVAASRGQSLIDSVGRSVVDWSPRQVVDLTVELLGSRDKPAIRLSVAASAVGATTALAGLPAPARSAAVSALAAATAGLALRRPPRSVPVTVTSAAVAAIGTNIALANPRGATAWALLGAGALTAARGLLARRRRQHARTIHSGRLDQAPPTTDDGAVKVSGLAPLITPIGDFYVTDVNLSTPLIDPARWRLPVTGLVSTPREWSLAELAEQAEEFDAVMVCIHNPVGGKRVGNGRWLGVPLRTVLERADPSARATTLVTRAVDGFTISLPVEPLRSGEWQGYVVIGLNGRPLPAQHGFPARVFVPGIYGQYTGVKWLTELSLTTAPHADYWSPRGWPHEPAWIQPQARIDVPATNAVSGREVTVAGVAWAPPQGVAGVEVRVGDGPWQKTELARELAPTSWRRWHTTLELPPGTHAVQARAVSRSGETQDGRQRPSFPAGASGWHTVTVNVQP